SPSAPSSSSCSPIRSRGAPIAWASAKPGSPAKVQDPYRPRCTCTCRTTGEAGSTSSAGAKDRNRCLPTASAPSSTSPSRCSASANRPCGLEVRTRCPPKARSKAAANRWTVCPSASVGGRGGGGLVAAGALVQADEVDPALVALLARERLGEEQVDQRLE